MLQEKEKEKEFKDFINKKSISDREKYIMTETVGYIQEILGGKRYTFEKIRVKVSGVVMLNLKNIEKL